MMLCKCEYDCVDEAVVPQDRDTLFMQALVNSGTVMTTFVGHDHGNAWCCTYLTLEICCNAIFVMIFDI